MFENFLTGLLIKLLDRKLKINYKLIDKKALEEWAYRSFDDRGWKSYLAYEDLRILKELSFGKERDQYHILIGRRLQLLYLGDEMRRSFENKKAAEEKRKSEAQNNEKKE